MIKTSKRSVKIREKQKDGGANPSIKMPVYEECCEARPRDGRGGNSKLGELSEGRSLET